MTPRNRKQISGISIIEMLIVVAAIGTLAAIAVPTVSNIRASAKESKLNIDLSSINNAVKAYVSSGGEILATDTAFDVLQHLKAELSAEDAATYAGFSGSFVDQRLTGKPISATEEGTRVVWDFDAKKFRTTTDLVAGIEQFYHDKNAEEVTENRTINTPFRYSTDENDEWVWHYGQQGTKEVYEPTDITTNPNDDEVDEPILITLNPIEEPEPEEPPYVDPEEEDPNRLQPPVYSINGGTHALADYKLGLTIVNPNTTVDSEIFFRYGEGGSWLRYTDGSVLNVQPDTEIDAFVFSFDPVDHPHSTLSSSAYRSEAVQLDLSLTVDNNSVSYWDLLEDEVRVRWNVTNLNEIPDYMKTPGFFSTYWTNDSSDPSFPAGRLTGEEYSADYEGESILLNPTMWNGNDVLSISAFAESDDTNWILHSEKPATAITVRKETLPTPEISLEEIEEGRYLVTLTATDDMPDGAALYYNATGDSMEFDESTGLVAAGTVYSEPFIWEPETDEGQGSGEGATGVVNIDRGDGDVPIQQLILRTNDQDIVQDSSVAFEPMVRPGADTMRGATVNDSSSTEVTLESITINDNGNIIVADEVNVLDLTVSNLNYPDKNLKRVTAYENGVKLGTANDANFGTHLQRMLASRDLRDYVKYDGNNSLLHGTPYDFDVTFSPLRNNDYLVVMERYGNSTFDLEPLDASGNVIDGSNKVVIREYSWNTGYAPSDKRNQPMFFAVIDIEKFGVDTDLNSITGFRVNNDGGADFKFFTISDDSFENRPVNYAGDLTAAAFPSAALTNWFNPSSTASTTVDGEIGGPTDPPVEEPVPVTFTFEKLTTSAGFLNEGFLHVNGVTHQFATSDDPAGGLLNIDALVFEDDINSIDIEIFTTGRTWNGSYQEVSAPRTRVYHSALHGIHEVAAGSGFGGYVPSPAKVQNNSYDGTTNITFAYEDLHSYDPFDWGSDNDYNDYNFEIRLPDWVKFNFGGVHFNY